MNLNSFKTIAMVFKKGVPKGQVAKFTQQIKGKKQINDLINNLGDDASSQLKQVLQNTVKDLKDPTVDIAMKAKSNYQIAALNIKDGGKSVANVAISKTPVAVKPPKKAVMAEKGLYKTLKSKDPKTEDIIKARVSVNNGKTLQANGFYDPTKKVKLDSVSNEFSYKNGVSKISTRTDKYGVNIEANTKEIEKYLSKTAPEEFKQMMKNKETLESKMNSLNLSEIFNTKKL